MKGLLKFLVFFAVLGALGFLGYETYREYGAEFFGGEAPVVEEEIPSEYRSLGAALKNEIVAREQQIVGPVATIAGVGLVERGYVAVTKNGELFGTSTLLSTGIYEGVKVALPTLPDGDHILTAEARSEAGALLTLTSFNVVKITPREEEEDVEIYTPQEVAETVRIRADELRPALVEINKGDTLTLTVINESDIHELSIPELRISRVIPAGTSTDIIILAREAGVFRLFCRGTCGEAEAERRGTLLIRQKKI